MKILTPSCFKFSSDDWHPCYEGDRVRVTVGQSMPSLDSFFVRVSGEDDEMWDQGKTSNLEEALLVYEKVIALHDVTKEALEAMGFQRS